MGTTYQRHPKPSPDKNAGRSATKVSTPMSGGQKSIKGTMGKHQQTGDGQGGGGKGGY